MQQIFHKNQRRYLFSIEKKNERLFCFNTSYSFTSLETARRIIACSDSIDIGFKVSNSNKTASAQNELFCERYENISSLLVLAQSSVYWIQITSSLMQFCRPNSCLALFFAASIQLQQVICMREQVACAFYLPCCGFFCCTCIAPIWVSQSFLGTSPNTIVFIFPNLLKCWPKYSQNFRATVFVAPWQGSCFSGPVTFPVSAISVDSKEILELTSLGIWNRTKAMFRMGKCQ